MDIHIVMDAKERIQLPEYGERIQRIRDLSGLPEAHFERFYQTPILNLVQTLAYIENGALVQHLDSVIVALKLRRSLMLPLGLDAESVNAKRDLWTFGIFVSSMLYGLHELLAFSVIVNPTSKASCSRWNPFDFPVVAGSEIAMKKYDVHPTAFNATMLPRLFDNACMTWLYRDREVFNTVLTLIVAPSPRTELGAVILKAHGEKSNKDEKMTLISASSDVEDARDASKISDTSVTSSERKHEGDDELQNHRQLPATKAQQEKNTHDESLYAFERWLDEALSQRACRSVICDLPNGFGLCDPAIFQEFLKQRECKTLKRSFIRKYGPFEKVEKLNFGEGRIRRGLVLPVDWKNQKQIELSLQDPVV